MATREEDKAFADWWKACPLPPGSSRFNTSQEAWRHQQAIINGLTTQLREAVSWIEAETGFPESAIRARLELPEKPKEDS